MKKEVKVKVKVNISKIRISVLQARRHVMEKKER